ncbi:MAG TPA: DUF481 domain-containing protein [Vicinamibacterales bacterium]|nr:DUF481 domain-containing protein [Vicinamibacterales bacterium]
MTCRLACLAFLLLQGIASAQDAAQPGPPPPPPRHEGSAEFAFVSTTGNADTQTLGLAGEYFFRPDPWTFEAKAGYVRNKAEEELSAESFRSRFRAARKLTERLSVFGSWDYLHDAFAGIDHRNVVAAGVSYQLIAPSPHELIVDGGLGYTNEQRLVGEDISTAVALAAARYKYKLSETAEISEESGLEFSLSDGDAWRWNNIASVSAKLTTLLSLKLSNTIRYAHAPAPGFETTDTVTAVALVAKF